jgi:hypothetical protein
MKKAIFFTIGLFFGLYSAAQEVSTDVYVAATPKGATKLVGQGISDYLRSNFKISLVPTNQENTCLADGVVICFWSLKAAPEYKKTLEDVKTSMDAFLKKKNTYITSDITTINGIRFFVWEFHNDDETYIRFMSDMNKNKDNMDGIIQFKAADSDKAHEYAKDLLASMHFKE